MRRPSRLLWLPVLALLAGCVTNPYKTRYSPEIHKKVPKGEALVFAPSSGRPELLSSTDIKADAIQLLEQGYYPIGRSEFREQKIDGAAALRHARDIGADLVLVKQEHAGTGTYSVPVNDWQPDRRIITNETVASRNADGSSVALSERQTTTVIEGEYATHYELQSVDYYEHTAVYWRKLQPPRFGVYLAELDDATRKAIQSNKGVSVRAVVRRSPAFLADLFRGDVLRRVDGQEILGVEDFFEKIARKSGGVDVDVWREGRELKKRVALQ